MASSKLKTFRITNVLVFIISSPPNDISVVRYWIFDSNYEKALVLNRELLDMICALSVDEEEVAEFETVFTAVGYIFSAAHLKK